MTMPINADGDYYETVCDYCGKEKLIRDLDALIKEKSYEPVAEKIGKKEGISRSERLHIEAEIYLEMKEKGYSRLDMAR